MTIWYGRWHKYYGKRNRKLEVVFVLLFYIGWLWKTVELLTQRMRRRELCKYFGMNDVDKKGSLRWNSAMVNQPGQRRTALVETKCEIPQRIFCRTLGHGWETQCENHLANLSFYRAYWFKVKKKFFLAKKISYPRPRWNSGLKILSVGGIL